MYFFRDIILDNKMDFTDIIKFFNGKPKAVLSFFFVCLFVCLFVFAVFVMLCTRSYNKRY